MKKNIIRLTEQDLHSIIKEAVESYLSEAFNNPDDLYDLVNDAEKKINGPVGKIKGALNPKWKDKKNKQISSLYNYYNDVRRMRDSLGYDLNRRPYSNPYNIDYRNYADPIKSNNEDANFIEAWDNFWGEQDPNTREKNIDIIRKFKYSPQAIENWFNANSINYKRYLG